VDQAIKKNSRRTNHLVSLKNQGTGPRGLRSSTRGVRAAKQRRAEGRRGLKFADGEKLGSVMKKSLRMVL